MKRLSLIISILFFGVILSGCAKSVTPKTIQNTYFTTQTFLELSKNKIYKLHNFCKSLNGQYKNNEESQNCDKIDVVYMKFKYLG